MDTPSLFLRLFYSNANFPSSDKRQEHAQCVYRPSYRMKSRISLYVLLGLLWIALGGTWFFYRDKPRTPLQVFPAVIHRDCAPWDGSAFTVLVPLHDGSSLAISIYRSPEIKLPSSFSFPDESMRVGNALLLSSTGSPEQLTGKVWFQHVDQGVPVEGRFRLQSETGTQFEGRFVAEWGDEMIYCG
jgi:hypothetical protein